VVVSLGPEFQYRAGVSTLPRELFAGLIDDAAMFPPGNASAGQAVAEHARYRKAWFADLVGPLLVPARAWEDFRRAHAATGGRPVSVVLIGTTTLPSIPPGVRVAGFEVPVPDLPLPVTGPGLSLAAEVSPGPFGDRVLAAVAERAAAGRPVVGKFRTGGTTPAAFPSEDVLAGVITSATAAKAPLKLTAGLHHAVRFTDDASDFEHHGFLNVLAAVSQALADPDREKVANVLALREGAELAERLRRLSLDQIRLVRQRFVSFGCCGVEDPIADLVALGVVQSVE
jgi:hypothetical protein